MTVGKRDREENHNRAFRLMLEQLGDQAIDSTFFDPEKIPFNGQILRTTWEELVRQQRVALVGSSTYRLTPAGWVTAMEISGEAQAKAYQERVGKLLAAMKAHVKPRTDSAIVPLHQLSNESGEPEGWIFNIVESRPGSAGDQRIGAHWYAGEKGRLIEIPVDFNLEPVDVTNALTQQHLERIKELEVRIVELEEERKEFHCPYCDAPFSGIHFQDFVEYHCIVTYETFACGYSTADGEEDYPCPYGANWPQPEEFEFGAKEEGDAWVCRPVGKTKRAKRVDKKNGIGRTKEEAEEAAKKAMAKKERQKDSY